MVSNSSQACPDLLSLKGHLLQVYDELGDDIRILKIDTDENPDLSSQLQVCNAPRNQFARISS